MPTKTRFSRIETRIQSQGHSDPKTVRDTPRPHVYPHTKFGIPISNNGNQFAKRMRKCDSWSYAPDTIYLELRPEVNAT